MLHLQLTEICFQIFYVKCNLCSLISLATINIIYSNMVCYTIAWLNIKFQLTDVTVICLHCARGWKHVSFRFCSQQSLPLGGALTTHSHFYLTAVDHPHTFSCKLELGSDQEIPSDWYPFVTMECDMVGAVVSQTRVKSLGTESDIQPQKHVTSRTHYHCQVRPEILLVNKFNIYTVQYFFGCLISIMLLQTSFCQFLFQSVSQAESCFVIKGTGYFLYCSYYCDTS